MLRVHIRKCETFREVQLCSCFECTRKTFSSLRYQHSSCEGSVQRLSVMFIGALATTCQNLWDGRRAGETCHFVLWSTSHMNKQPPHYALSRFDGIHWKGQMSLVHTNAWIRSTETAPFRTTDSLVWYWEKVRSFFVCKTAGQSWSGS